MWGPATAGGILPRRLQDRIGLVAVLLLVVLTFAATAALRVHAAVAGAWSAAPASGSTITPAEQQDPEHFTIGDLAAGRVPQDVQDRFWQAQLDAILAAPCPDAPASGGTGVMLYLGADDDWATRLSDAAAARRAACDA